MVEVETLEHLLHLRQLGQSAVAHGPVGQERGEFGEDVKPAAARRIGVEEGGYHHVGGIGRHRAVGRVERLAGQGGACGIRGTGIVCLNPVAVGCERTHEFFKRLALIALVGRAGLLKR